MKKRRIGLLLAILVLLPMVLLGWQALQMIGGSEILQKARVDQLIETRLRHTDSRIHAYLQELALDWSSRLPDWSLQATALREKRAREIRVKHLFLLDEKGKRVFPSGTLSLTEQRFIERLQSIWDDPGLLFGADDSERLSELRSSPKLVARGSADAAERGRHGWTLWHWGATTRLLFWWQAPEGHTLGLEIESARVKSDLIALLPETTDAPDYSLRLKDAAGQILYHWGPEAAANEKPLVSRPVSYPLSSWSLDYFGSRESGVSPTGFGLVILLAFLALALGGMALYLYREHSREMRLAEQRVAFVGQVSHELKTPLTNIRMYAELLADRIDDDSRQRYLQVITSESQRLSRLIGNVLTFSRQPKIHKTPVDVDPLIETIADNFQPGLAAKGIALSLELQAACILETDPDQLEQILNNLLSNVEKYAAAGKAVTIRSRVEQGVLVIQVRDYGPGIPTAERKRVFKAFYRIDNRLTEGVSGTGIGLTIARQQAQRLGGELVLLETTPGACFELRIPLGATA